MKIKSRCKHYHLARNMPNRKPFAQTQREWSSNLGGRGVQNYTVICSAWFHTNYQSTSGLELAGWLVFSITVKTGLLLIGLLAIVHSGQPTYLLIFLVLLQNGFFGVLMPVKKSRGVRLLLLLLASKGKTGWIRWEWWCLGWVEFVLSFFFSKFVFCFGSS